MDPVVEMIGPSRARTYPDVECSCLCLIHKRESGKNRQRRHKRWYLIHRSIIMGIGAIVVMTIERKGNVYWGPYEDDHMNILYIATISLTLNSFFKPHIEMLVREGHHVDIACNFKFQPLDEVYRELGCNAHQIDFSRSPLSRGNGKAYRQLRDVIEAGQYDIVHCHTPNAAIITRLVCQRYRKKTGLRVFYTAHGFHFYEGAPRFNWLVYYPVEKFCSRFTDKLITINKEDHELARDRFKAKEVCYVPGVGIDLERFQNVRVDRNTKRREIGVPEDAISIISVGELIERKNHKLVLQALTKIDDENIHYTIVGDGPLASELQDYAKEHKIAHRVHFLGYRKDIAELYAVSDVCCLPSVQEGLPVALMEGMACGLPAVCSRIRGNTDLIGENGGVLFAPDSVDGCRRAILDLLDSDMARMGEVNKDSAKRYSIDKILAMIKSIHES